MDNTLNKLKGITSDCCVTIILQTHRAIPDNNQDAILLKDLVKEAGTSLLAEYDKELATSIIDKIYKLSTTIDHRYNLDTLVLFVNENISEYIRLPIKSENRVVIDKTFATRELLRCLHREVHYYVLTLSRDKARLIEALNDKVAKEIEQGFPMENAYEVPVPGGEAALFVGQNNLVVEFFNRVDQQLNEIEKREELPVIICTDESNYPDYLKVANRKEIIAGQVNGSKDQENVHQIVDEAWPVMKKFHTEKNRRRLSELSAAVGAGSVVTDINEIWKAIGEGRGRSLFVKQGYFLPVKLENDSIELTSPENVNVEDIIDEMIERNIEFGGDAVFITGNELEKYQGLVLVTRY